MQIIFWFLNTALKRVAMKRIKESEKGKEEKRKNYNKFCLKKWHDET